MVVKSVTVLRVPVPLTRPYHTSFGDLPIFDSVIARMETDEGIGWGESSAVPGYSWETPDDVWNFATAHAPALVGQSTDSVKEKLLTAAPSSPFGVTPLLCALEEASSGVRRGSLPLAAILNTPDKKDIPADAEKLLEQGFQTIKFKIGFNLDEDIRRARLVLDSLNGRARLRLDANQHYTLEEARKFAASIDPEGVELLEQPFDSHNWDDMARLAQDCPLPLMLDESIYGREDIEKAASLRCCNYIKLKLCKSGGMEELLEQGLLAGGKGMKVVIGNGVATDISCRQEIAVASELKSRGVEVAAGEMNGFLKQKAQISPASIKMSGEEALVQNGPLQPDYDLLHNLATEEKVFSL